MPSYRRGRRFESTAAHQSSHNTNLLHGNPIPGATSTFPCTSGRAAGQLSCPFWGAGIGELSSTLRSIDEEGGRPDPLRRAALKDALEPQDRIAGRLGKTLRRFALPDGQSPFTGHLGSGSRRQKDHRAGFGGLSHAVVLFRASPFAKNLRYGNKSPTTARIAADP
jgi:hypothetical protein